MDKLKLRFDIIKTKLFIFMAIAGSSWIYATKSENELIFVGSLILFLLSSIGIGKNLIKLGKLEERIDND